MQCKRKIRFVALVLVLCACVYFPIKVNAKCLSGCSGIYSFRRIETRESSYDHTYIYGTCHVKVTEKFEIYECPCGAKRYEERISRVESHSQPH